MRFDLPGPIPETPVASIKDAVAYYRDCFGFVLDWGDEELGLAGISRGNCRVFLASQKYREQRGNVGPVSTWLNLESKEAVDALYRAWAVDRVKTISAPESKPWGLHEFTMADLDGNLFRVFYDFATPPQNS